MIFVTAFITGLLGSFHCAGMCGPIALATPTVGNTTFQLVASKLVYNVGRIITYSLLGLLLGIFGFGLKLAGLQQSITIIAGSIIIINVLLSSNLLNKFAINPFTFFKANSIGQLFKRKTYPALVTIGLLNGLLPCGFVYIGLIGAVATQQAWQGALFMIFFGLGTLPMMFTVSLAGQILTVKARGYIQKFTPALAIIIGCIFILRGLNLGVPYLSPKMNETKTEVQECCKPQQ
jgi:uncharacterized protein